MNLSSLQFRLSQLPSDVRQYALFQLTAWLRLLPLYPKEIDLAENVRLQRISSLFCSGPDAAISIGKDSIIYERAQIHAIETGRIAIGAGSIIGDARIFARQSVRLGSGLLTSWNVFIQDYDPHPIDAAPRAEQVRSMTAGFRPRYGKPPKVVPLEWKPECAPIEIGENCWLGANVTILKGVTIGANSIVATGSVVTRGSFDEGSIIAGNPARCVKTTAGAS